jgi:PAS domain S-box-containing protein
MTGHGPDPKNGQRVRYLLVMLFVILAAAILVTSYVYYQNYEKNYKQEMDHQLTAISDLKVNELVNWKTERMADAGVFFHNPLFSSRVQHLFNDTNDTETREELRAWLEKELGYNQYDRIYLMDTTGTLRMSVPATERPVAATVVRQLPPVLPSGNITILDFYQDDYDQKIYLTIIVPLYDDQEYGESLGYLAFQIDPGINLYPYISEWPGPSESAETLVVRREGSEAVYLNNIRFNNNSALILRFPLDRTDVPAVKAALGEEGMVEGTDYRGVPVIAAIRKVPGTPWSLVTLMDTSEVYGPLREQFIVLILIVAILLIGIGTGIGIIWREESTRFDRDMYESEREVWKEREKARSYLEIVGTTVIAIGTDQTVIMVNPAGCRLLGRHEEDVLGKNWFDTCLPERVRETSREGFVRMLARGISHPEPGENVIVTAGGEERSVTWHSTLIRDEDQAIVGILGSGDDITDRKLAETTLLRVNQKLNVISQLTRQDLTNQTFVLNSYLELAKSHAAGQDYIIETLEKGIQEIRLIHETIEYSKDYQDMGAKPPTWQNVKMMMLFGLSHISIGNIRHSIETGDLGIFADPLLEKVCQRLFENSVKHGGHVTRIRVWHTVTPNGLTIFFEDDGIGIPQEKKEQIFLRSEDTGRATTRSLIFVREILSITGITIRETGEPGKGVRFEMAVPKGAWRTTSFA